MPSSEPQANPEEELAVRIGGAALGLLAGMAVGAVILLLLIVTETQFATAWVFFASALGGALIGFLSASVGIKFAEAVVHFFIGTAGGFSFQAFEPSPLAPRCLRWVLVVGTACGLVLLLLRG